MRTTMELEVSENEGEFSDAVILVEILLFEEAKAPVIEASESQHWRFSVVCQLI